MPYDPEEVHGTEVEGITLGNHYPNTMGSPHPVQLVRALVRHGTHVDAAKELGCSVSAVQSWVSRFAEFEEAYLKGRRALGHEAEQTQVMIMRGQLPDTADEEVQHPRPRTMLNAAKKVASVNHVEKDYSQSQKIIRKQAGDPEQVRKELEEMSQDELLDALNSQLEDE